jgi:hypothetical protein
MTKGVETYVVKRLERIEEELKQLRELLSPSGKRRKVSSLRGIWKGVKFTEADIEEAKRALTKKWESREGADQSRKP